ncbi:protease SohB [Lentisalinibacter orientalis]|jgi:serine protease SohB|uniref:protease SohB n=1 Tax=Lentisalinibacter orientalis TaxID=2992241 RepID=UPI0038659FF6
MEDFFANYGLFLAKTITFVAAVLVIIAAGAAASRKVSGGEGLKVENLNERYRKLAGTLKRSVVNRKAAKALAKAEKAAAKKAAKSAAKSDESRPRTFVVDFKGDIKATGVAALREEVSAVLAVAGEGDEVLLRLENAGGMVHEHGLAASQLVRLREAGVKLTVAVDRVAASGGYLMACIADRIVAAPFAILGSIGVLAQLPNFNRMLDNHGVEFEQIAAGKYKRTVTMFGKNTEEDRDKLRQELEEVHTLFQDAVGRYRPDLDMEKVATGEHWYGTQAIALSLADELATSDELLVKAVEDRDVYKVTYEIKQPLPKKVLHSMDALAERAADILWRRLQESRYLR